MVATSLISSFSPLTSSAKPRRLNRYSTVAMASASVNVDNVKVTQGLGNLQKIDLTSVHGSEAEIYLFGGCITSWKVASKDLLFVRPDAVFNGKKPISGGIPHCFPQFGPGAIQQHGFARNVNWSLVNSENVEGNPIVTLELKDSPYSRSMWDYSFLALYKVTLDKNAISTELRITNTDEKPFSFTTALHSYFRASASGASVTGLKGCKTLNKDPDPKNPVEGKEERDVVTFPGFVDCVYLDAPEELQLNNGLGDKITIKNTNWSDAVLWNPHLSMEACYKDFVCVENAKIGQVQLEPNQSWTATQMLILA
ncbi:putative glucose-6-phosphate 1-epimerase [Olea europaea var. sylvestris]|uniref:glucose-6-phosphate 1-epimerase n=1 Tax=Olea europaea subsp. europaea TaxID=158383 RepID=A0A8S0V5Q2_OLEEU|nr:putative glucose-6-phosphate 1-epimerase [Olea europaea var. sylvestris]XP_022884941.1 putative glucose-6-phosphate 1-epimerase [Olea europaea var. sylvestris]CAA3026632.1 glucose-6-phosphate 1-epimerase [Olea europaea subsp. europaea]